MNKRRRSRCVLGFGAAVGWVWALAPAWTTLAQQPDPDPAGRVVFHDDFSGNQLERGQWVIAKGARLAPRDGIVLRQPARGRAVLRSRTVPLDDAGSAVLFLAIECESPHDPGVLTVEYRDFSRAWRELTAIAADSSNAVQHETLVLPPNALHGRFAVRFRVDSEFPNAGWRLLDVRIESFANRGILSVSVDGDASEPVSVMIADGKPATEMTPFVWAVPLGERVRVVAPPRQDREVFDHWIVNDRPVRDRSFSDPVDDQVFAEAHYQSPGRRARTAFVYVDAAFAGQVAVDLALGGAPPYATDTAPYAREVLVGEQLRVSAPARTDGQVFRRWVVDGRPVAGSEPVLTLDVTGDVQLVAEYLLVGDMNADGVIDEFDVDAFSLALADPQAYAERFPDIDPFTVGDMNADGRLDEADVDPFVRLFFDR